MASLPRIPWYEVDPRFLFVKKVKDSAWALAIVVNGKDRLVDFQNELLPNLFSSEGAAQFALDTIGFIFSYLKEKQVLVENIDPEVDARLRRMASFTPEPMAPLPSASPATPVLTRRILLDDEDPALEDVRFVLDLIDEWRTRRGQGKHCTCVTCVRTALGFLWRLEDRYAAARGQVPDELARDIARARGIIMGD